MLVAAVEVAESVLEVDISLHSKFRQPDFEAVNRSLT